MVILCKAAQLPHHHCMTWLGLQVGTGLHRHGGMPLHLLFGVHAPDCNTLVRTYVAEQQGSLWWCTLCALPASLD